MANKKYLWRAAIMNTNNDEDVCELPPVYANDDIEAYEILEKLYPLLNDNYAIFVGEYFEIEF